MKFHVLINKLQYKCFGDQLAMTWQNTGPFLHSSIAAQKVKI